MSRQRCATCYFYRHSVCKRHPPIRLPRKFDESATSGNRVRQEEVLWGYPEPPRRENDWCGEYRVNQEATK